MKKQQRSEAKAERASSAKYNTTWKDIDFHKCEYIKKKFTLQQLTEIPIKRHIKIRCEAKPFDPSWDEYFERRKLKSARQRA